MMMNRRFIIREEVVNPFPNQIHFAAFKAGPGGRMARLLGIDVDECSTWIEFTRLAVEQNDGWSEDGGHVIRAAKKLAETASSGELPVLLAVMHAADFSRQADELAAGKTWVRIAHTAGGDHALAIAACIARID